MFDEMTRQNASKFAMFYIPIQKSKVAFPIFHFVLCHFSSNECPGLCQHRPGHSLGENKVAQHEKRKKQLWVFVYLYKIWQILKHFARSLHQA